MTYLQYRLAKRNGEIIQQRRKFMVETKSKSPLWKFWHWGLYVATHSYGEWEDVEIPEVAI